MSSANEHHGEQGMNAHHGPRALPASLAAPPVLVAWRTRALMVAAVFALLTLLFAFTHEGRNHIIRAYLMGYMTCFNFAGGALVLLMLQYVSGGKWGLLLRRPLEAMTRTLPLVAVMFIPILLPYFGKHLYQWILYPDAASTNNAMLSGLITREQALTANFKRPMLNPHAMIVEYCIIYAVLFILMFLLNRWSLELSILSVILLSRYEPMKTLLRVTEQHDLAKLTFAFVMLNIYLTFAEFLIIWSGNLPDELPWYLNRIHGGWWTICTLDFVCHWLIPFCLLLSRDLKRNKKKMIWLTCFMLFARLVDMFWLIEPNFKDSAGNLH